jgi:hypothetical protein
MGAVRGRLRSERGSTIAIFAVMLFGMMAMAALAIDLASLRDAKAEAQRAADMIALAGANAFRKYPAIDGETLDSAQSWALTVARVNKVRFDTLFVDDAVEAPAYTIPGTSIEVYVTDSRDVTLNVIPDSQKVRAWVRRPGVQTFFGGLLAVPYGHVQAKAAAWATDQGPRVNCLKPFVMPDMWKETDKTTQDVNGNDYMDPITEVTGNTQDGESWKFQPPSIGGSDYYVPYGATPGPGQVETGYGSPLRSSPLLPYTNDVGLPLLLKPQTGSGNTSPAAERMGNAFWMLNLDPDSNFKAEVKTGCATASVGDSVPYDNGSKTAVRQPINELIQQDPGAHWDETTDRVEGSLWDDWTQSPRVVIVGLISPEYWIANSSNTKPDAGSKFTNFVRIFFEPVDPTGPPDNIKARYIGPAPGVGGGPTGGPLVKILQLIE